MVNLDSVLISIMALASLGAIIWLVVTIQKKYKNLSTGEMMHIVIIKERQLILLFINVIINLGEAVMAASIIPANQPEANHVSRYMIHLVLGLGGIFAAVIAALFLVRLNEMGTRLKFDEKASALSKAKAKSKYVLIHLSLFIIFLLASWAFPIGNGYVIAGGLKQTHLFVAFVTGNVIQAVNNMYYILIATCMAIIGHIVTSLLDCLLVVYDILYGSKVFGAFASGKSVNESINEKDKKSGGKDAGEGKQFKDFESMIRFLLLRYYKDDPNAVNRALSHVQNVMKHQIRDESTKSALSGKATQLALDIQKWDASEARKKADTEEVRKKNLEFDQKIYDLFKGATGNGDGFGQELKKKDGITK